MQLYKRLRWEYEHGLGTIRGGAQKYKVHRRTVRAALQNALPPKRKVTPRERPKMALAIPFIDAVLENNLKATFSNQLTAHQIWVRMQVEMPGCDIGESTVRAYVRVRKAEVDEQQTSSQAAAAWMMGVLHRNVPLRFIEKEFPSSAASSLAGIINGGRWRERKKASCSRLLEGHPHSRHCSVSSDVAQDCRPLLLPLCKRRSECTIPGEGGQTET